MGRHDHSHSTSERAAGDRRALVLALVLISSFMVAEVIAGIIAGSLALLADAAHMLTDVVALAVAVFASSLAGRPARGRWTFGFGRVEILAAQLNGITLLLAAAWIVYAAIGRLISPPEVRGGIVLVVALAGIAVNLAAAAMLARSSRSSLNVRGAFLHLATDVAAFAGTAIAAVVLLATGWDRVDPLVSIGVAGLMVWASLGLLRESTRIFLESAPADVDPHAVGRALVAHPEVVEAHDVHVWTVTSGFPALSAHVLVRPGTDCHAARRELGRMLAERFGVEHTTLQVDHAGASDTAVELDRSFGGARPLERHE